MEEDLAELWNSFVNFNQRFLLRLAPLPRLKLIHPWEMLPSWEKAIEKELAFLKKQLGRVADLRATSARWAWVEYRLSQGGQDTGVAAYRAWERGGRHADWVKALEGTDERAALNEANIANLWLAAGMK